MPVCRLETREDVEALRLAVRWFDRPGYFRVELLAPNTLSSERCTVLRRRLAFALSDCGCFLASAVLLVIPLVLFFVVNSLAILAECRCVPELYGGRRAFSQVDQSASFLPSGAPVHQ